MEMHLVENSTEGDFNLVSNIGEGVIELSVLKKLLKVVRKKIDKKINSITKLQIYLSEEESELRKYFDEQKQLRDSLKTIKFR